MVSDQLNLKCLGLLHTADVHAFLFVSNFCTTEFKKLFVVMDPVAMDV